MSRQKNIEAQIKRATEILPKIEAEYNDSLHKQDIAEDLKLDIQTFCGHLRSALDYLAKDIVEKYCPTANPRLYFPITDNPASFQATMARSYPGLETNCRHLYDYLQSIQPFQDPKNLWLSLFNKVNNENKHNDLVEQKRTETKTVTVTTPGGGGASVSWGPGVTFGNGVSVLGVPIDPRTQMPVQNNTLKTEVINWVDFKFEDIDVSALKLLKDSRTNIESIASYLFPYLD